MSIDAIFGEEEAVWRFLCNADGYLREGRPEAYGSDYPRDNADEDACEIILLMLLPRDGISPRFLTVCGDRVTNGDFRQLVQVVQ